MFIHIGDHHDDILVIITTQFGMSPRQSRGSLTVSLRMASMRIIDITRGYDVSTYWRSSRRRFGDHHDDLEDVAFLP
jgi:hypothetical protein